MPIPRALARSALCGICGGLWSAALVHPTLAAPIADFYSGKRINYVVGQPAGSGSYDQYARMLARSPTAIETRETRRK